MSKKKYDDHVIELPKIFVGDELENKRGSHDVEKKLLLCSIALIAV